eukprot:TRINITY_DN469_c0_g1_i1.p1 TRINITY_DN469_c0_g1~~TRINITY_DN469_c0_g1_i1.p1  ORF type:complete len:544 (-),score=139.84 TRINITY_DN469_c0_g1_i1:245-1876(-)
MADTQSLTAALIDSTTSKIQQLQQAFTELESHGAVSLNLKWKELEEHFYSLERSLKQRLDELKGQQREYETKVSETREMLEKREAIVVAKEQTLLERLQEKRDAALLAIGDAFDKYKKASAEPIANVMSNGTADPGIEEKLDVKAGGINLLGNKPAKNGDVDVMPRPELTKLCEEMDVKGLHKFISDNRKNLAAIREEIPFALKSAADPAHFVLESLEDFYCVELPSHDGKKDSSLLGLRRTCIMLLESLASLLSGADATKSESASDTLRISWNIRAQAKVIADNWKPKLDDHDADASSGNSLEVHAFLQLLATYGLTSEFDQDELCKLIPTVSRRRQMADLCRSLGLSEKMPGVIEVLINSGRQMEAINLAYAFELTEQFYPVSLLKAYLKDAKKASQVKGGNMSPSSQNDANEKELSALKVVIKCIEDHKLEDQYPVDPLQKRVLQLEKAKADKKRAAEASKPQSKRPRANGSPYGPRVPGIPEKSFYRAPERYPYMYDRPYPYAPNNLGSSMFGSASYTISPTHASYYGNGYQYPTPYIH